MFQYHCLNPIAEKGLGLFDEEYKKSEDLQECDAVLVRSAKMHDMELPESVKVIARAGAGVNNIPVKDCAEKGVVVFNTPGANANGVKELVLAGMLLASRDIVGGIEWVAKEKDQEDIDKLAEKQKKQFAGCEIMGKKLGIHAYGNVGRNVARIAKGFGMEIYAFDAFCPKEVIEKDGVKAVGSAEELYSTCDVVSLHIPATAETKNSINYALVNKMPKGALLVNTARKEVINEAELIQLMEERTDLKYMTDIMPAANETFAAKFAGRYFSTPKKMGAQTAEANINAGIAAAKQIVGFLKDGCEKFRVNRK